MKTGVAFGDYITRNSGRGRKEFDVPSKGNRDFFLIICAVLVLSMLFIKVFFLQVVEGSRYRDLSNSNRIKTVVIHAPRGAIYDRQGKPLVFNIPGFRKTVNGKTTLLGKNEAILRIAKGESLEFDSLRQYPYKDIFSHVLGYIGEISKEELETPNYFTYSAGDFVGKMGVEQYFQDYLRGVEGRQLVEIEADGTVVRKLGQTDPVLGKDVTLTLDLGVQKAAYEGMSNVKKGAVIVSTPKGEILGLLSKPTFDPNLFTLPQSQREATTSGYPNLNSLLFDLDNQPLLNRAISGTYPPGSTFKLVVAASGLQNGIINENYTVADTGVVNIGAFSFSNWYFTQYGKTEGPVNVVKGIKRSNDIFFYKLAEKIGVSKVSETAFKFGLGNKLGIDLIGEEEGIVPTPDWKKKTIGEPWYLGDTYHYGIGQGYLLTTPLQVNSWTQTLANEGVIYSPHLLKDKKIEAKSKKFLNEKTVSLIRQGMIESCNPGGVAWPLFEFKVKNKELRIDGKNFFEVPQSTVSASFNDYRKVSIACKTGTAQHGGEKDLPHAWITLFAPAYDPEIVVTVLAESSGEGSNIAAPVAKKILEEWFSR